MSYFSERWSIDCFQVNDERALELKPGFTDPGGHLAACASVISQLRAEAREDNNAWRERNTQLDNLRKECDLWKTLQHSIQTETEKALVRRVGELQAELLELRTTRT